MRFEDAYKGWTEPRLTEIDAAQLLGGCPRAFRRTINRYEEDGLDGLIDKRLAQDSHRRAPVDAVMRLVDRYRSRHQSNLMPATVISRDGRVIAKRPSMNDEGAIWAGMIEHYDRETNLAVKGMILPALEILMQEHRLQENDFAHPCMQSPIVPIDRERPWAKALYAGYDHDFVTAIHRPWEHTQETAPRFERLAAQLPHHAVTQPGEQLGEAQAQLARSTQIIQGQVTDIRVSQMQDQGRR